MASDFSDLVTMVAAELGFDQSTPLSVSLNIWEYINQYFVFHKAYFVL